MTDILFTPCANDPDIVRTWWQGELRIFMNREAAEGFAKRQGLTARFEAVDDGNDGSEI